ncbi:hypothetical protein K1T71_011457 [Dendrolimus kikuchii]|uniref:Uncharacterized protein n=1 Tax=Dendrolimus kikuchii TaxID=765133 RepID=A0ACC1CNW4_9NEOP|nr:hypothetical protein K1T71_011457 [Dendrolimus kikuchii]
MSGEYPFGAKTVSPAKCNEKPWDLWVSEIGHLSPRRDDDAVFTAPAVDAKGSASRRVHDAHPYKLAERHHKYRRAGLNRLRYEAMSLHGLFPQMDNLNAAVCHMCGVIVKCSAAYRHLLNSHTGVEPLLPPPAPVTTVKSRSRHKKEAPPPIPIEMLPVKMETSPVHTATAPLSRIVLPQPELQYLEEASTSAAVTGEVQVCVESGELPVVSIQDTDDLRLGENLTDDIFAIMNSEGIQSADDITNAADWKNIIQDIGNMQEINFAQATEPTQPQDLYSTLHTSPLPAYTTLTDADLSSLQFAARVPPMLGAQILEARAKPPPPPLPPMPPLPPKPAPASTPTTKASSRSKTSKTKFNLREYDPNKHCGVVTAENPKPCTRSLTCKAHALSLRRTVEGRAKPFDTLLAEHRALRDANAAHAASAALPPTPAPPPPPPPASHALPLNLPPLLVNTSIDLGAFNGLTAEQQVNDIYASLLSVEDPNSVLPDTSSITSLLSQPLATEPFMMPDDAELPADVPNLSSPAERAPPPRPEEKPDEGPPPLVPSDVCWYASCPRPLALCTFNASHAGGAITLGKRFATVRSDIKSSLSRSQCKAPGANSYYYAQNSLSLSKSVHMNASKTNKPEVRKLIVTCGSGEREAQSLRELFAGERLALNGHVPGKRRLRAPTPKRALLDLGFALDPLLADEKC